MTQIIGIIGSGLVGKAVARLAVAAGYHVVISNSRGPETLADLVEELGSLARAGTVGEAIASADIVLIAIPLATFEALPADKLAGKIVLDQSNYYPGLGEFRRADLRQRRTDVERTRAATPSRREGRQGNAQSRLDPHGR